MDRDHRLITTLKAASILVALVPIVMVGAYIALLGLNIPYEDQWEFVPLLVKLDQGTLSWSDLFAQHNEHRPVFPRLLWLTLARLSNYNTNAELWLNLGIAIVTFSIFVIYTYRLWQRHHVEPLTRYVGISFLALLIFNLVQWESWLLGFQTVMYLGVLCVMAGFMSLAADNRRSGFVVGVLLGVIATYSMVNALLYWPIGLLVILSSSASHQRIWRSAIWCMMSIVAAAGFLYHWTTDSTSVVQMLTTSPILYVHWILNYIGAPLLAYPPAFLWGILSLALLALQVLKIRQIQPFSHVAPYWATIIFTLASAIVTAIGRSYGGPPLALAPRYITQTAWYWAALLVLMSVNRINAKAERPVLLVIAVLLILSTLGGAISGYKWRYLRTWPAYHSISSGQYVSDAALGSIYGEVAPAVVRQRFEILCQHQWSACTGHAER